jgi:hypothetical protein
MSLTREEKAAVKDYSGAAYFEINEALRSGVDMDEGLRKAVDRLDSAIAKSPTARNLVLYRGVGEDYARALEKKDLQVGDMIAEAGFLSTSTREDVARRFLGWAGGGMLLKIHVPIGSSALDMHPYSKFADEHEFLLPRDAKLRAIGYDANADALELEVV